MEMMQNSASADKGVRAMGHPSPLALGHGRHPRWSTVPRKP